VSVHPHSKPHWFVESADHCWQRNERAQMQSRNYGTRL
jgi:hypothetical protein